MNAIEYVLHYGPENGQMGGSGGWEWWGGIVPMVVFALLLAIVVLAIVRFLLIPVVGETEPRTRLSGEDEALSVLRERYARGEIDEEEFERRKRKLTDRA